MRKPVKIGQWEIGQLRATGKGRAHRVIKSQQTVHDCFSYAYLSQFMAELQDSMYQD